MVSSSPTDLAGDVGALRGTANNLSTALGTAFSSVVAVSLLSLLVMSSLAGHPTLPPALQAQVPLDNINFVTNEQLEETMSATTATPEQVAEAVRVNEGARLLALKASFIILAAIALLAIFPSRGLPNYTPGEVSAGVELESKSAGKNKVAATV
jgi:hypothetical protein